MAPLNEDEYLATTKSLAFFASPAKMRKLSNSTDGTYSGSQSEDGFGLGPGQQQQKGKPVARIDDGYIDSPPEFHRREEATNMELFYDLFFVANLTTFSTIHEINDIDTLTSYIGFFCILWFTWCQVSSFDVRFVADSVWDRAAKAVHMGVMVAMATVGPNFDTHKQHAPSLKTMALVLMVSRFVLALQYLGVGWHVRKHRGTKVPFSLIAAVNFSTGIIYLGVSFTFGKSGRSLAYRSFYVLAVFEIVCNISISIVWKVLTFKHTHLVQRMSLLTLIILGEGAIVVSKNIAKIVQQEHPWDNATIGILTAAVGIIYFLYMLYFDALPNRHFGSTRQQIWAFLHFPFHLALILYMEGTAEFVIWHKMWEIASNYSTTIYNIVTNAESTNTLLDGQAVGKLIKNVTDHFTEIYPPQYTDGVEEIQNYLDLIVGGFNQTFTNASWIDATNNLTAAVMHSTFETYGFEIPESATNSTGPANTLTADGEVISLVYIYFFISAGMTLVLMGVLNLLTLPRQTFTRAGLRHPGALVRILVFLLAGAGLSCVAASVNYTSGGVLALSAWILPLAMLVVFVVGVVQYVPVKSFAEKEGAMF